MPERPEYLLDRDRAQRHAWKQERDLRDQKASMSRPGQVYHTMTSLQDRMTRPGYQNTKADIDQLKGLRRDWNRNQKYTPMGMHAARTSTPRDAQKLYSGISGNLRAGNRPAYNKMYPISGAFMDYSDMGGLPGLAFKTLTGKLGKGKEKVQEQLGIAGDAARSAGKGFFGALKSMGSDIFGGIGIGGAVPRDEATEEVLTNYADKTFGPYPTDIHPGLPIEDVTDREIDERFIAPPEDKVDVVDDITVSDLPIDPRPNPNILDPNYLMWDHYHGRTHHPDGTPKADPTVIPGHTTSYVDRFAPIEEEEIVEEVIPSIPFDDSVREAGIASLYGQGPQWGSTNRRYEDEYRDYVERIGNMPGGPMTYEEFSESWEDIHQGKPHAGLR